VVTDCQAGALITIIYCEISHFFVVRISQNKVDLSVSCFCITYYLAIETFRRYAALSAQAIPLVCESGRRDK
jgi:hypothetical protein